MFQEIFSNGLTLVPAVFAAALFNAIWFMITGQRMSTKEHGKARYFAKEALRMVQALDVTGDALIQTPWIRHFAPYYSGFKGLVESSQNMLTYLEVIPYLATLEK
jgi:hypothetical protein